MALYSYGPIQSSMSAVQSFIRASNPTNPSASSRQSVSRQKLSMRPRSAARMPPRAKNACSSAAQNLDSYGLYRYGLYSYGLDSDGLCSFGLYSYGLTALAYVVLAWRRKPARWPHRT